MKYWIEAILLFATALLSAEDFFEDEPPAPEFSPPSLVDLTSLPSSNVNNVNVISGNLITSSQNLIVSGPDLYIVAHTLSNTFDNTDSLASNALFHHYHLLRIFQPRGINFVARNRHDHEVFYTGGRCKHGSPANCDHNPYTYAFLTEPSGHTLVFKGNGWAKDFALLKKNTGYTNICGNGVSGKTNIKNIKMHKYSYRAESQAGRVSDVHYVRDPKTGELMDFKFKTHSKGI